MEYLINAGIFTVVIAIVEIIRDWKNKRGKDKGEAKKVEYEAQRQGLDLVQEFYNKVKQITDDQNKQIFERLDKTEKSVDAMVKYLNGGFDAWRKEHSDEKD